MQAAKRKRTRYAAPPFPVENSTMQCYLCQQNGELFAYLNPNAFVDFLWNLWEFVQQHDPMPYAEELSIWYPGDSSGPPVGVTSKGFALCQITLEEESYAQTQNYKTGEAKLRVLPDRFDLYVPRSEFMRAFLDAKAIGRRRHGKTVKRVKLFDTFWLERVAQEYWPPQKLKESVID